MRYRGGPVGEAELVLVEVEASSGLQAAELVARQYGLDDQVGSYEPDAEVPRVWTELVDSGGAQLPAELWLRRTWEARVVRALRVREVR